MPDARSDTRSLSSHQRGRDQTVEPPQGFDAFDCWNGAFSPDGMSLAVPVRADAYAADRSLALVDVARGVAVAVGGSAVEDGYVFLAWSTTGDRVFMSGGRRAPASPVPARRADSASPVRRGAQLQRDGGEMSRGPARALRLCTLRETRRGGPICSKNEC
jgi:hypothetical protein